MKSALLASALIVFAGVASAQEAPAPTTPPIATEQATPEQAAVATPLPSALPSRERPPVTTDEGGLWGISDRAEQQARQSGQLESDAALNAYLREISCRVASAYCGDIRLYVMNRPYFNASMAPNGYMEVWSGLLLRAEDEAQLAFVLGHEIGHYSERHSLEQLRTIRSRANLAMVLSIAASAAGAGYIGDLVYLGTLASVFGFSREKETEADMIGFDAAVAAGYDANAGHLLWTGLIGETRASDNPDTRRSETRGSIFRTHPLSADRIEALEQRAQQRPSQGQTHRERYRAAIRPHLDAWLRADLRRRDYSQTLYILDRLAAHGEDLGVVEYYRGEIYRIRRGDGDLARAKERYIAALTYPDVPAAAWRELGDINLREGAREEAANNFRFYLEKAPNAEDRALVEARIAQLTGGGPMNVTRRALMGATLGGIAVASCATGGIRQGTFKAGRAFTVNLTRGWSDLTWMLTPRPPNVRMLSIDGPLLNRLYLAYLEPGQSMFRPRDRDTPRPTFRADMSDTEVVEFIIDCTAVEFQSPTSSQLRPQNFGTAPGVRFDISARTDSGLNMSGTALAARSGDRLNLILYLAPSEHYYATLLADVEAAMASATLA